MSIPEAQLETWSHQGSITQSSTTYQTIKNALEADGTAYKDKDFKVFLQGSYGNDTNIYGESDVDVVIQLNSVFYYDLEALPPEQKSAFKAAHPDAAYQLKDFRRDVLAQLQSSFGNSVDPGNKAIKIKPNGSRRSADVLVSAQFRRYSKFLTTTDRAFTQGICFFNSAGRRIDNYPQLHAERCTAKHQATGSYFKPLVRIFKNLRSKLVADGVIDSGLAPSYYVEGLLHNVPNDKFGTSYTDSFVEAFNWLNQTDRSKFVCAHGMYYLLRDDPDTCWSADNCQEFLNAILDAWNEW